jgi:hypothetical protein
MKDLISVSVASVLALGAAGAHASIALPSSGSSDAVLFAEVISNFNAAGSSVVASYAGDTGVGVNALLAGLSSTPTTYLGSDQNLKNLFAADGAGDTVVFGVLGAQGTGSITPGVTQLITTNTLNTPPTGRNTVLNGYLTVYSSGITALNTNLGSNNSIEGASPSSNGVWDIQTTSGIAFWGGGLENALPTSTASTNIYYLTAGSGGSFANVAATLEATATLSANGLVLTGQGGSPPPVPLPAAVWLLGSGLLGLAGVARRKAKA